MTPLQMQVIYDTLYQACLKAAQDMGDDLYKISWFGKNHTDIDVSPFKED